MAEQAMKTKSPCPIDDCRENSGVPLGNIYVSTFAYCAVIRAHFLQIREIGERSFRPKRWTDLKRHTLFIIVNGEFIPKDIARSNTNFGRREYPQL